MNMVFKVTQESGPDYFKGYFEEVSEKHHYQTRMATSGSFTLPKVNSESGKRTFRYMGAIEWNQLPVEVRRSETQTVFKARCNKLQFK